MSDKCINYFTITDPRIQGCITAINPDRLDKLITSLRTAVDNDGTLDKESTSYNDIFDAFRLALKFYHFRDSSNELI
jgi:hypothetical protein